MDNSYGLLEVQKANLYILKEIDRICKKYNLKYMLDAGTLLGAIRHNGFIPWDDDADIAMTRSNFEVFRKIVKKELPNDLELLMPSDIKKGKVFYDFTPRIILKRSKRHKDSKEDSFYDNKLNHLWVDIFILDALPKSRLVGKVVKNLHKFIYLLAMGHRYKLDYKKYSGIHKILIFIFSTLGRFIPMPKLYVAQDVLARKYNKKKHNSLYYSNYQPDYLYVNLEKIWLKNMTEIKFEDILLSIPEAYDEILNLVYGDYMTLPRKEDRKASHGSKEIEIYE